MEDVNSTEVTPEVTKVETETTAPEPQKGNETVAVPSQTPAQEAQERMVPISVVQKERKQRQEMQRRLAELEGRQKLNNVDPNDYEAWLQSPFSQELMLKDAKRDLTDYAKDLLDQEPYSSLHPQVKKAIIKNARGFVNENTTDVENAKLDLLNYIEEISAEADTAPVSPSNKGFPVTATNAPATQTAGTPTEVAKILEKPVDTWTDEEAKVVDDYTKTQPKK